MDARAQAEERIAEEMEERAKFPVATEDLVAFAKLTANEIEKAAFAMHPKPWPEHEEMDRMWARVCAP